MTTLSRSRRVGATGIALFLAFMLFRGQLAAAVVTRGDDVLRSGDVDGAMRLYARALQLDKSSGVAADRLAFRLALSHRASDARNAVEVVGAALEARPATPALLADRAFAELRLNALPAAERDFARAGDLGRDARYEHFASRIALRRGDRAAARAFARRALGWDRTFNPARALLGQLR